MSLSLGTIILVCLAVWVFSLCDRTRQVPFDWDSARFAAAAKREAERGATQRRHARRALEARRVAMAARTFQYSWWWGLCYLASAGQCRTPEQLNRYVTLVEQYWDKDPTPQAPWPQPHPSRPGQWPVEPRERAT